MTSKFWNQPNYNVTDRDLQVIKDMVVTAHARLIQLACRVHARFNPKVAMTVKCLHPATCSAALKRWTNRALERIDAVALSSFNSKDWDALLRFLCPECERLAKNESTIAMSWMWQNLPAGVVGDFGSWDTLMGQHRNYVQAFEKSSKDQADENRSKTTSISQLQKIATLQDVDLQRSQTDGRD